MNLHAAVRPAVAAVNRPITGNLLVSTGSTTTPSGKQLPTFSRMNGIELRVQSLGTKELAHADMLNIQGTLRAVYQYLHAEAVSRPLARGGDLLEFADPSAPAPLGVWLVAAVLESWPGWCKVIAQLQMDGAGSQVLAPGRATPGGDGGFGFTDLTDYDAPTPLALPEGVDTQVVRNLGPSSANNQLKGVFAGHSFWDGTKFTPRALNDVIAFSIYMAITPQRLGGQIDFKLTASGKVIEEYTYSLTDPVGAPQGIRADFRIAVRSRFFSSGGIVTLNPTVPCSLTEFSPEIYPESAA